MLTQRKYLVVLILLFLQKNTEAQDCSSMNFQWKADINSTCNFMAMSAIHDEAGRPYLYFANKEGGLAIYDISDPTLPALKTTLLKIQLDTLDLMALDQEGNYLYLVLGNSFTNPTRCAMAIVDVSNPLSPFVTNIYRVPGSSNGGGIVRVEGNYAYFGAMQSGLYILDISDKNNIQFVSKIIPSIYFPVSSPNPNLYNARGMEVRNSIVYLCYDAGGIRIINCSSKTQPYESGRWCNPVMYKPFDHPKAYNNCVLDDTLLYVATDYAGMEILSVKDTGNIRLVGWWNPLNAPANNWFTSRIHSNEILLEKNCGRVLLSTGKSDLYVVDVSDPSSPDSCNIYGGVSNSIGTWGVSLWQNQIYLSYICAIIPFSSNWTGIRILEFNDCSGSGIKNVSPLRMTIYPNPFQTNCTIKFSRSLSNSILQLFNASGQLIRTYEDIADELEIEASGLSSGIYYFRILESGSFAGSGKIELIAD